MNHLSNQTIYRLAGLVAWDMGFGPQDAQDMRHMVECESCYRKLCANMAMMEALDEFGMTEAAGLEETVTATPKQVDVRRIAASIRQRVRVEIGMTVSRGCACLEVLSASGGWSFGAPMLAGCGGTLSVCPPSRLEDMEDEETCVEVNPADQSLSIRLSERLKGIDVQLTLIHPTGEKETAAVNSSKGARIPPMPDGKYRIILEK